MEKTYDILVNFKNEPYEFYEWERTDKITNIKSIPIFPVETNTLSDFVYFKLKIDKNFLKKIENETELYNKERILYSCILYNYDIAFAFLFDQEGYIVSRSKLLFEESDDIIKDYEEKEKENIIYEVISKEKNNNYKTRKEEKIDNILNNYIDKIYKDKKFDQLKYIYLECFNEEAIENEKMIKKIKENISDEKISEIILNFLKVLKK